MPALIRSCGTLRPAEHGLEHEEQHHREQQRARDRMHHHGVEPRQQRSAHRHAVAGVIAGCGALRAASPRFPRRWRPGASRRAAALARAWRLEIVGVDARPARARRRRAPPPSARPARRARAASAAPIEAKPRCSATSLMLSATIIGRPRRFSSSTSRRFRRRLVASTTHTMQIRGGARVAWRPSTTSRVIASSSVVGLRL